ncbi:hypothetical protein TWF106_000340 [Orbilia oligospora]|uniref:F-box domain-containing protein n=1 Tax=Orbilia oligospora TaxID=2813651 RepID=A0A7C8UZP4_ORBOL|nr:hypothetical protein TWF106_000340 [Orbilia oligospora]
MATIFDLPNELMDEVGIDLDEDDWLALRMTCQELSEKCKEYHLNSKYTRRRVLLVQESIENLAKISQHSSGVNLRVRYLDISCLSPYALEDGFYNYKPWDGRRNSLTDGELKMIAAVRKFSREHHKQIEGVSPDSNIMIAPLIQALPNLPNLQSICFNPGGQRTELTRPEWNLFYPSLEYGPGTRINSGLRSTISMRTLPRMFYKGWDRMLPAICSVPTPSLRHLTWNHGHAYFITGDQPGLFTCEIGPVFPNLKVLKVIFRFLGSGLIEVWMPKISQWLNSIGCNLEELELDLKYIARIDDEIKEVVITLPESRMFSSLSKLRLVGFRIDVENLKVFLTHCKQSLKEFTLSRLAMQDPKEGCFEVLKFLSDDFKLKLFKLALQGHGRDFITKRETEYALPDLEAIGDWSSKSMICTVWGLDVEKHYCFSKHLGRELWAHNSPDVFWDSITEGIWVDREALGLYDDLPSSDSGYS